jgi:hypothetical protein
MFWAQFWPDLLATFSGVALALWLDRWRERAARKAEEKVLLRAFRDNLTINLAYIARLGATLAEKGKKIPTTLLDVGVVDAILPRFAQVSRDTQITTLLAVFGHMLHQLNRRLDHLMDVAHQAIDESNPIADIIYRERVGRVIDSIAPTIPNLEKLANDTLLPRINARLGISAQPHEGAASPLPEA